MPSIQIPDELEQMASRFHQDFKSDIHVDEGRDEKEAWVRYALQHSTRAEQLRVKEFLQALLAANPREDDLEQMWDSICQDWFMRPVRDLLSTFVRLIP